MILDAFSGPWGVQIEVQYLPKLIPKWGSDPGTLQAPTWRPFWDRSGTILEGFGVHLGTIWVQFLWNFVSFGTMSANFTVIIEETVRVTRFRSALSVSRAYPGLHAPPGDENPWKMKITSELFFICVLGLIFNDFWMKLRAKMSPKSHPNSYQKRCPNSICFWYRFS